MHKKVYTKSSSASKPKKAPAKKQAADFKSSSKPTAKNEKAHTASEPARKHPGDFKKSGSKKRIKLPASILESISENAKGKNKIDGVFSAVPKSKYQKSNKPKLVKPADTNENEIFSDSHSKSDEFRLNKYLSHAGVASRRKADELIKEGKVKVNGVVVTEMGYKVMPNDRIEFDGKKLSLERKYYLLLNKPKDYITTLSDEHNRRTVVDLIRGAYQQIASPVKPRLYPVGRLDRNTTGVLLLTNDGELAQRLTHPSSETQKVYHITLDKKLRKEDFDKIAEGGVVLEDGIAEVDEIAYPNPNDRAEVGIQIHTGKNRFIRRLFEALGYEVVKLDRVYFAGLTKKDLPRGRWRFLSESEVRLLKHFPGK